MFLRYYDKLVVIKIYNSKFSFFFLHVSHTVNTILFCHFFFIIRVLWQIPILQLIVHLGKIVTHVHLLMKTNIKLLFVIAVQTYLQDFHIFWLHSASFLIQLQFFQYSSLPVYYSDFYILPRVKLTAVYCTRHISDFSYKTLIFRHHRQGS